MSIAFVPISTQSDVFDEKVINKKWDDFVHSLTSSFEEVTGTSINSSTLNTLLQTSLEKQYSILNQSTQENKKEVKEKKKIEKKVVKKIETDSEEEHSEKEEKTIVVKKVPTKKEEKKKDEKPKCKQILKNNTQCKSNAKFNSDYCTRHQPKSDSSSEESENEE